MKKISEMGLDELWKLFPIYLTKHQPCWKDWYEEEADTLKKCLPVDRIKRISHIGSTAVDGIWAKPIIDILVETSVDGGLQQFKSTLSDAGYRCMSEEPGRISFNKGYTEDGFAERVYHLHLRVEGDHDELYFRDYLNEHPDIAEEYEVLKLRLWKQYEHNRDAYTERKTDFVREQTRRAKSEFGDRYEDGHIDIVLEKVEICKKDILFRLLQYSLFEESISDQNDINEDAIFEYPWFENYFTEEGREAYFIKARGSDKLLGFVMVNEHMHKSGEGHSIAEFMVLPKFRRNKIGKKAAIMCLSKYKGNWEVSPSYGSVQAYSFWKNVIDEYTEKNNLYENGLFLFSNFGKQGV